jgi:hypothetical protein
MYTGKNTSRELGARRPEVLLWLWLTLLAVLFTPTVRLPGGIPLRIDDLIIAGVGSMMLGRSLLRMRVSKLDGVSTVLLAMAATMPLSAIVASQWTTLPIGLKEYLDLIRPLKFIILYAAILKSDFAPAVEAIRRSFRVGIVILLACALIRFFLLTPDSSGLLVHFFLLFPDLDPNQVRSYFGGRSFATFQTPTDLGYVMTVFLVAAMSMGGRGRWGNRIACLLGLVLSGTRTFLFVLPLILGAAATNWFGFAICPIRMK